MKILLVDDKTSMRDAMKVILVSLGMNDITEATDGQQALRIINAPSAGQAGSGFDVVISDMEMPRMNGLELLRTIRQTGHLKDICFIMATTVSSGPVILETMRLGIQAYIVKPFDRSSVVLKLKQAGVL